MTIEMKRGISSMIKIYNSKTIPIQAMIMASESQTITQITFFDKIGNSSIA